MAPRAKPKKKSLPIANGDDKASNSSVATKKTTRTRKNAALEKNAEAATPNQNNQSDDGKPVAKVTATLKTAKTARSAPTRKKIDEKIKTAPKKNDADQESSEQEAQLSATPKAVKASTRAPKKAVEPKTVTKSKDKAAATENGKDVPPSESNGEGVATSSTKAKAKGSKETAKAKTANNAGTPKGSKKKTMAKSKAPVENVESLEVPLPQPSTSTVMKKGKSKAPVKQTSDVKKAVNITEKGSKKRENPKAVEAIAQSPKAKRVKNQTVATVNHAQIDVKVEAPKRAAFSKQPKNISEDNDGAVGDVAPIEAKASKKPRVLPKSATAALPEAEQKVVKKAPSKRKAAIIVKVKNSSEAGEEEEVVPKKSRKTSDAKPKTKKVADAKPKMNATKTEFEKIDFGTDKSFNMKICSFNVAGLRAFVEKGGMKYFEFEQPNIICLQEIKCLEEEVPAGAKLSSYHPYWFSKPGGRGGVAILSKTLAQNVEYGIGDEEMDYEGRIITAEFEKFYVICVYVPNAGNKLVTLPRRLVWNKLFEKHVTRLNKIKPVIIAGDMNVAHTEIDLANPKTNTKNAGFTKEEREGMTDLLSLGFTDAYRYLYPSEQKVYTFWSFRGNSRSKNVGWRLDYFIISNKLNPSIADCVIRPEVLGSDHCPINLLLNI